MNQLYKKDLKVIGESQLKFYELIALLFGVQNIILSKIILNEALKFTLRL